MPGIAARRLERFTQALAAQAHRRLQLIGVELAEEEVRLTRLLFWELLAAFLCCVALALAVLFVVALYWETPARLTAIAWTAALCAAGAVASWRMFRALEHRKPPLFGESVAELRKDEQAFHRTLQ